MSKNKAKRRRAEQELRRRKAARQKLIASNMPPATAAPLRDTPDLPLDVDSPPTAPPTRAAPRIAFPPPRIPTRLSQPQDEPTEAERWWDAYEQADGPTCAQMVRDKLTVLSPDDEDYEDFFPDAIEQTEGKLGSVGYVALLEEIRDRWPRAFSQELHWNTWSMALAYVGTDRWADLERAVGQLVDEFQVKHIDEPLFSLLSLLRLADRGNEVQRLLDTLRAHAQYHDDPDGLLDFNSDDMDDVFEASMFPSYHRFAQAGATEEAFEVVFQDAVRFRLLDSPRMRSRHREIALHMAGKPCRSWTREKLLETTDESPFDSYLLLVDYARWLTTHGDVPPLVADEFRLLLLEAVNLMEADAGTMLCGLEAPDFERYLARKLNLFSLSRFHVPASIVVMHRFYGFLAEKQLVDEATRAAAQQLCAEVWDKAAKALQAYWPLYGFVERYKTWNTA